MRLFWARRAISCLPSGRAALPDGLDYTEIREIAAFNAWHIASNAAGTQVFCDTNHPDRGIFLIDVATGAQRHVCMSDASNGGSQWRESRYALAEDFARARSAAKRGNAELDGSVDRHGLWTAMDTSASVVFARRKTHRICERSDGDNTSLRRRNRISVMRFVWAVLLIAFASLRICLQRDGPKAKDMARCTANRTRSAR